MSDTETSFLDVRTSALLRITSAIVTATTLDELLLLALSESARLVDVPRSGILLLKEDDLHVQLVNTFPPRVTLPPQIPVVETVYLRHVIATRQPLQIDDCREIQAQPELQKLLHEEGLCSVLLVPLVAQDKVIGVLGLGTTDTPRSFTEVEVTLIRVLTGPLGAAISAFHTTEAARRRSAELATLNDISAAVTSSLDTREVYHRVVQQLNEYFHVDAGSLLMRDDETGELEFVMTLEGGEEKLAGVRVPPGQGVVGHVAESQKYEIVLDAQNDPRFYSKISEDTGYITNSILCVPMIVKGRTIGVIELLNKRDGNFTDEDASRLMRMATTIGVAIENARLFQEVVTGRERFQSILNSSIDGILMADMRGIVVTANPVVLKLFQITEEQLIGRPVNNLLDDLRSQAVEISSPPWLIDEDDETGISDVTELEMAGSRHMFVRHFSVPVYNAKRIEIGQLLIFQDISKERELSQLRDDFMSMLVHDLRAPVTAIMNGIMMIQRGMGGPVAEKQLELLAIAYHSSQIMLDMVNTLLDISKMEQGRMPLNYEPISPYALVDEPIERLRASAESNHVTVKQHLPVGLPLFEADRDKVVRVLQNLLDNAIKFSPTRGEVTLGTEYIRVHEGVVTQSMDHAPLDLPINLPGLPDNHWMIFWISDQGEGIPLQYHEHIFEKFAQVRRGRKARGSGLGLTFCKLAVESHGGRIWLESGQGRGSTFAVAFPIDHDPNELD